MTKRARKIYMTVAILVIALITLFVYDPAFRREMVFSNYSVDYEWRILIIFIAMLRLDIVLIISKIS